MICLGSVVVAVGETVVFAVVVFVVAVVILRYSTGAENLFPAVVSAQLDVAAVFPISAVPLHFAHFDFVVAVAAVAAEAADFVSAADTAGGAGA